MMKQIYLDHNATTPIIQEVSDAMRPYLDIYFGNPSSNHSYGFETKMAIAQSRQQLANLINCNPEEIIFTSGGTESNNYAIKGIAYANAYKGKHIITSNIEHPAVTEVCKYLKSKGFEITYLSVNHQGVVEPEELGKAIRKDTILISVMHANNETGAIQPIEALANIANQHNIIFHSDAAQSLGKIPVDVKQLNVQLLSIAGHKFYGPKGIGALYIAPGVQLEKLIHGADHERNLRAGTENVLQIVGLGKAAEIAKRDLETNRQALSEMRDLLEKNLKAAIPDIQINAEATERLPNTSSISFPNIEANTLLDSMEKVAASAGAACHTDNVDISQVLQAMQIPIKYAMGTIRFSVGRLNNLNQIDSASKEIIEKVKILKKQDEKNSSSEKEIKLTQFTHGLGCACKMRPQDLENILNGFTFIEDDNVLVGLDQADDAAVYRIGKDVALVQTVDFFTPIVDNPYDFGAIAAANALSDVYAMGGKPIFALNVAGFPSNRLPLTVLKDILRGANDKAKEAGISILGGHTIEDTEPKFGMVVSGMVHPEKVIKNTGAKKGDVLLMTKPIGTGILSTALKRGLLDEVATQALIQQMSQLNKVAGDIMRSYPVSAATDISGFGLLGHLKEMLADNMIGINLFVSKVPVMPKVKDFAIAGVVPGGTINNIEFTKECLLADKEVSEIDKMILADAQTSGGLLIAISPEKSEQLKKEIERNEVEVFEIGAFTDEYIGKIYLKK